MKKGIINPQLLVLLVVAIIGIYFLIGASLSIVPGWSKCSTETIEYKGLSWEVEGCPLGAGKHLKELLEDEFEQKYFIEEDKLLISSTEINRGKSLPEVTISTTTVMPETKEIDFNYFLMTVTGESKITIKKDGNVLFEKTKPTYNYPAITDKVDQRPGDDAWNKVQKGDAFCSNTHPRGRQYGSWNTPHCWLRNLPKQGDVSFTFEEGSELEISLLTQAGTSTTEALLKIFTEEYIAPQEPVVEPEVPEVPEVIDIEVPEETPEEPEEIIEDNNELEQGEIVSKNFLERFWDWLKNLFN